MLRIAFLLAFFFLAPASEVDAQTVPPEPGSRIPVTGCGTPTDRQEGSFEGMSPFR